MSNKTYGRVSHLLIFNNPKDGGSTTSLGSLFPNTNPGRTSSPTIIATEKLRRIRHRALEPAGLRTVPRGAARLSAARARYSACSLATKPLPAARGPAGRAAEHLRFAGAQSSPRARGHTADIPAERPGLAHGSAPEPSPPRQPLPGAALPHPVKRRKRASGAEKPNHTPENGWGK